MRFAGTKTARMAATTLLLSATLLGAAGCGQQQAGSAVSETAEQTQEASSQGSPTSQEAYDQAFTATSTVTTFIGEKFYDKKVTNEDEALEAVKSVYDRIGADNTTELEITAIRPVEGLATYYIFRQVAGDVFVYGASVKLITNTNNEVVGLVSAILPNVQLKPAEEWAIDAAQAEKLVTQECEENGNKGVQILSDSTEQTIIAVPNNALQYQFAWVVYTNNYNEDSEMGYLAHYVDAEGKYLYALPISEPHDADAESGDKANFDFTKYKEDTWTGEVDLHDGTKKQISVPALVADDNQVILGDAKRKILCADFAEWQFNDKLQPSASADASFNNTDLLAYDTFIKVWDFFDKLGWKGPDGDGTPTLLLMNLVDEDGEPYDNAIYKGRLNGFQTFTFNRINPDGENMDIVAHEFTHCITSTTMTTSIYQNETGAINEGMSDVLGNLVEMIEVDKPETAWLMGDSSGGPTLRNMKDPHEFSQPEFRWDAYYTPSVSTPTELNDMGGVHTNSSMLNIVSYRLDQAGMAPKEQFNFWMSAAFAMTPRTDYAQMAELLPWCMEQSGYSQYVDALNKAITEAKFVAANTSAAPSDGTGVVSFTYPYAEPADQGVVAVAFTAQGTERVISTWPAADAQKVSSVLPAGTYTVAVRAGTGDNYREYRYTGDGWELKPDGDTDEGTAITVEAGKTQELATKGLPEKVETAATE